MCLCPWPRPRAFLSLASTVSVLGKAVLGFGLEPCVLDSTSGDLISPIQNGFKKNRSTNEAVLDIYNKLLDNMDKKLVTCSIFLDLRKAFDTINHTILIKKLEKYGIRGLPLQLLASYLTDRQQYTIVNQYKSKSRDVIFGIPQGSTLGPLLFNIYINDLPLASNSTIHLFADDTNLTLSQARSQKFAMGGANMGSVGEAPSRRRHGGLGAEPPAFENFYSIILGLF